MTRTITNYQKAYRKKVEGLKIELSAARTDNSRLKSDVRRLRRRKVLHAPSLALGLLGGWLAQRLVVRVVKALRAGASSKQQPAPSAPPAAAAAEPAPAVEPEPAAAPAAEAAAAAVVVPAEAADE
jgi:hypothetical protein